MDGTRTGSGAAARAARVTGRATVWALGAALAATGVGCKSRAFNPAPDADTEADGDGRGGAAAARTWFACVEAGKSTTWRLEVPAAGGSVDEADGTDGTDGGDPDQRDATDRDDDGPPRPFVLLRDGRPVFRAEARGQIDRAEPTARLLQAYGVVGARAYRRVELSTPRGNVTVDWARGSETALARTLFLALRVQGDGFQAFVRCDTAKAPRFSAARLPGLPPTEHARQGVAAFARATSEWRPLDGEAGLAPDGARTHARCDVGDGSTVWRATEKDGRLVVVRASAAFSTAAASAASPAAPAVDAPIVSRASTRAEETIRGTRYATWTRAWKVEGGEVVVKEFSELFVDADEDVARGARWTVPGLAAPLSCEGEPGMRPPDP